MAIALAIKPFCHLAEGHTFHIVTDHKPLAYAFPLNRHTPRQIHHQDYISQLTTDIRYMKGSNNSAADALPRQTSEQFSSFDFRTLNNLTWTALGILESAE